MSDQPGKLSIDIIGCGSFGTEIAELISGLPQYEIRSACDASADRARAVGEKFGVPVSTSYEECLARSTATQGVAVHPDGSLYITDILRRTIFKSSPVRELSVFCDSYQDGTPLRGPNEITFGPNGHVYFTDPGNNTWRGDRTGAVTRVNEDGKTEVVAGGLEFNNGLDCSPDGKMLYVVESTTGRILRVHLELDGKLKDSLQEFVRFGGRVGPDGIRFAANGDLYVTLFGQGEIAVVSPAGEICDRIRLPGLFPTNCIFHGGDLLVCEGQTGDIWKFAVGVAGVPSYAERIWPQGQATQ